MVLAVIFFFGRQVHNRLDRQGEVREQHAGKGFIRNLTLQGHMANHSNLLLWSGSLSCVIFSMLVKVNFDGGECCWEEEEEEEEELCWGRAGGGRAGSPFKEGSFVGFLL